MFHKCHSYHILTNIATHCGLTHFRANKEPLSLHSHHHLLQLLQGVGLDTVLLHLAHPGGALPHLLAELQSLLSNAPGRRSELPLAVFGIHQRGLIALVVGHLPNNSLYVVSDQMP